MRVGQFLAGAIILLAGVNDVRPPGPTTQASELAPEPAFVEVAVLKEVGNPHAIWISVRTATGDWGTPVRVYLDTFMPSGEYRVGLHEWVLDEE